MTVEYLNPVGLAKATYSHVAVVSSGRTVYVSGQVAADESGQLVGDTFAVQARQVFDNLRTALAAVQADFSNVVKMNTFVVGLDAEKVTEFRVIRAEYLGAHLPASTLVDTGALVNPKFLLEIEVIAVVD